jgi:hypothetical protein
VNQSYVMDPTSLKILAFITTTFVTYKFVGVP